MGDNFPLISRKGNINYEGGGGMGALFSFFNVGFFFSRMKENGQSGQENSSIICMFVRLSYTFLAFNILL